LQVEAERGFAAGNDPLVVAHSVSTVPRFGSRALLTAVPGSHVRRLESILAAAHLRPISFSLGSPALQSPGDEPLASLRVAGRSIHLQVTASGGIILIRTIDDAFESDAGVSRLRADWVRRELRITLGQLPPEIVESLRRAQVFGSDEAAEQVAVQLRPWLASQGIEVE